MGASGQTVAKLHESVHLASSGDRRAQEALVARFRALVRATIRQDLARTRLLTEATIEDLSQATWMGLIGPPNPKLAQWRPGGMSLAGFICQAARWEARMYARAQRAQKRDRSREVEIPRELPSDEHLEGAVAARQASQRLAEHLRDVLPPRGLLVFKLLYEDELDVDEISKRLGVKRQVVYNWKHRIRQEARKFLDTHC